MRTLFPLSPLTFHSQVDFQLSDVEGVLTAAEVESFVLLADVDDGQCENRPLFRQDVLWSGNDDLLLQAFSPGGAGWRHRDVLGAGQSDAVPLHCCGYGLPLWERGLWENRETFFFILIREIKPFFVLIWRNMVIDFPTFGRHCHLNSAF